MEEKLLKKWKSGRYISLSRLLFDMVQRSTWNAVKDWNEAKASTRRVNGETYIQYEYALELLDMELEKAQGIDPVRKRLNEKLEQHQQKVKALDDNAVSYVEQGLIERLCI